MMKPALNKHALILITAAIAFCALLLGGPDNASARASIDYPIVKLRSLDKITARTQVFEAQVGRTIKFGAVYIKVQTCRKAPELERPESAAFLQVWEIPPAPDGEEEKAEWIFSGWMFASSPGLSAMDHPIYDVWVLDCLEQKNAPSAEEETGEVESDVKEGEGVLEADEAPSVPAVAP